ncbi:peptidase family M49-domain-containing protein [Polychytrium aggregatum]|uniref:peptidase family M49-domain-containing protein n=1 Tax=Polychytrium aggregatum TaxID=110093 RepID=UPI0022FE6C74|nr:peptidase family M49-domain-containing protein [Polychytrium aggregatum]KAI9204354.1 peptidase family M49-domain-containing protein [Polychytrium aggregatum]
MPVAERFLADTQIPISVLEAKVAFELLTPTEKKYAHFIARAGWAGSRIVSAQATHHSTDLVDLLLALFTAPETLHTARPHTVDLAQLKTAAGLDDAAWTHLLEYAAVVLHNRGNYKSFGDVKVIPRLSLEAFDRVVEASSSDAAKTIYPRVKDEIFSADPESKLLLGFPAEGHVSGYYFGNVSKEDNDFVQAILEQNDVSSLNTRLAKISETEFEVRVASVDSYIGKTFQKDGKSVTLVFGEFAPHLAKVVENLEKAIPHAANEHQRLMLEAYVRSFRTGSIEDHKDSQRHWIKDIGPTVESNVGFIESYRDPAGVRAEWEAWISIANKEQTKKFNALVEAASDFIPLLPWSAEFEKDTFRRPDFTSLEVVTDAVSSGPPAGINIPNYDDIRMNEGFKNVSFGNIVSGRPTNDKLTFIRDEDKEIYAQFYSETFEVQVGLHELLGHGSGKLLSEETPGQYNFDIENKPISPLTGEPIKTWYKPGETWGSVFKAAAASYEECRAEAVAMHLVLNRQVLDIFGHKDEQESQDVIYISYLSMARAGLIALQFYDPNSKKWGQAHMQARYALLRVFLESGLVHVEVTKEGDLDYLLIHLDRSKIESVGQPAIAKFLQKLQIYKATADAENGLKFYEDSTSVSDEWVAKREIVLKHKQPRKIRIESNTFELENGDILFKEYPASLEGLVESYVERAI